MAIMSSGLVSLAVADVDRHVESAIAALRRMPYPAYLKTSHWQRQRAFALESADNLCELCAREHRLEVHHRTYARVGFERPEDLVVLCHDCHHDHHRALVLRAIRATEHEPAGLELSDVLRRVG